MADGASHSRPGWDVTTLLGRLDPTARSALLALGTTVEFPPDRVMLRQGEASRHTYLLLRGYVKVTVLADNGGEAMLGIRMGGDLVGEMALLGGRARSATVRACTPVLARVMRESELTGLLDRAPSISFELSRMISERLRWANERRLDFAAFPAPVRLSRVLLHLAEAYGRPVADGITLATPLTQRDLASLAGIKLPTAEKALRQLHIDGVIKLGYRKVVVLDLQGLRTLAGK